MGLGCHRCSFTRLKFCGFKPSSSFFFFFFFQYQSSQEVPGNLEEKKDASWFLSRGLYSVHLREPCNEKVISFLSLGCHLEF